MGMAGVAASPSGPISPPFSTMTATAIFGVVRRGEGDEPGVGLPRRGLGRPRLARHLDAWDLGLGQLAGGDDALHHLVQGGRCLGVEHPLADAGGRLVEDDAVGRADLT